MEPNTLINALFLCLVNVVFMIAGILLNVVVIISLWRSSQLRKKLCYFMILVLSCFDLAVVSITHPLLILSTILWSMEINHGEIEVTRVYTRTLLGGFSMIALLTLTIERFLALTYPFFHQTAVTKKRLLLFQAFLMATTVSVSQLADLYEKAGIVLIAVFILFFLFAFVSLNYKMFIIAKSKRNDVKVFPATVVQQPPVIKKEKDAN